MSMHIWVFSYNRGLFLQNCIESIERCAPMCPVTVFDDNSTDPETQPVLESIAKKHRVMKPEVSVSEGKHGGLYANMQSAFESMSEGELMCFLQDDMQLVRPLAGADLNLIEQYFVNNPRAAFINPTFLKGCNKKSDRAITRFDPVSGMYFVDRMHRAAGAFYSDALIGNVSRLRSNSWVFLGRESLNEKQARRHFSQMPYLRNPIAAFLPNVSAYRGKVRTWAMRRAELLTKSGFYPLAYMSSEEASKLDGRDHSILPYAEDFLHLRSGRLDVPWIYYPLQNNKLLKKVNSLEIWLRKKIS